jgi:hypothetical protein
MRSFNANFIAEKNRRADGPAPINLLTFDFAAPVYVSDFDVAPSGGPDHSGILKSWGFVDTSITQTPGSGVLGSIDIADLQLTLINTTTPRFSENFTVADPPENVVVTLYQWFGGLLYSEREIIFKGLISGTIKYDEYTCTLTIRGIFDKYNKMIGDDLVINAVDFPDADPDVYGAMQNIIYGSCPNVPCRAIVSGDVTSLAADITASQTSIELSDSSCLPPSGVIGVDAEQISYTGNAANTLTGCTRGYNATVASTHLTGVALWEERSAFVYQTAGHPVQAIGDIYVDGLRVTSIATKYTGQTGNELAGYEGQAVFTVPARLVRQQVLDILTDSLAVDISDDSSVGNGSLDINDLMDVIDSSFAVNNGTLTVSDISAALDDTGVSDEITVGDDIEIATPTTTKTIYPSGGATNIIDGCDVTGIGIYGNSCSASFPSTSYGTIANQYLHISVQLASYGSFTVGVTGGWAPSLVNLGGGREGDIVKVRLSKTGGGWGDGVTFLSGGYGAVQEVWYKEVIYTPTDPKSGAAFRSASPGVSLSGDGSVSGTGTLSGNPSHSGSFARNASGNITLTGEIAKSGSVSLSYGHLTGNSVADVRIGKLITADVDGWQDDAAGTYTGTPYALIERPDHVFRHAWSVLLGAPVGDIDAATFSAAGTFYAANAYKFALLINKPVQASDLLMRLALQCRSRFLVTAYGAAKLFVRQLGQTSGHSIPSGEIKRDSVSIQRSPSSEIINYLNLCYELDLTRDAADDQAYCGVWNIQNAASIALYGQREWKGDRSLFLFDAVRDPDMAEHVGLYLIDYHQQARRMPQISVFLDNMEIEPGDIIDITHPLDNMGGFTVEVQKLLHHLGSRKQIDCIDIVAAEN